MNKFYVKRLLSLLLVVMLVFPAMSFGSAGNDDVRVKSVYFQDESGNMVYVDYEFAASEAFEGRPTLYGGIKEHVGKAELKGKALHLETSNERLLDYGWAMKDNVFMLKDILATTKYDIHKKIDFTHELKLIDGQAKIVEYKEPVDPDPDPDPEIVNIISIGSVRDIVVNIGTEKDQVISLLDPTTTIVDSEGYSHTVSLTWDFPNYDGNRVDDYYFKGEFKLPAGIENGLRLPLEVIAKVSVVEPEPEPEEWPKEIEEVFVGVSPITEQTYVNINIKDQYVSVVKAVYVDGNLANQMADAKYQWRISLESGTRAEDLMGRISLESDEEVPQDPISVEFKKDSLLGEGFGLGNLLLESEIKAKYPNAVQYAVRYSVGTSGSAIVLSDRANLGEYTKDLVQYIEDRSLINIELFDTNGNLIAVLEDIIRK